MLVTLSGIVIDVRSEQFLNAYCQMLVTGHPPSEDGMDISPEAGDTPTTHAMFPFVPYVHVSPSTVSVLAAALAAARERKQTRREENFVFIGS